MNIIELYNSFMPIKRNTWLDGRSYSDSFILCISSGPWKENRRLTIQRQAISFLSGRDLQEINVEISLFPLAWQNSFLNSIRNYLQFQNITMDQFCQELIDKTDSNTRFRLYNSCNCPKGAKVLSLFLRDSVKCVSVFTIDRHVRRWLIENNLPETEQEMLNLCFLNGIDPVLFSTGIAQSSGIKNPDWSIIKAT